MAEGEDKPEFTKFITEVKLLDGNQAVNQAIAKLISLMTKKRKKTLATICKNAEEAANMEMKLQSARTSLVDKVEKMETDLIQAKKENDSLKKSLSASEYLISDLREQYDSGHSEAITEHSKHKCCINKTTFEYRELFTEHILLRTAVEKLENELDQFKKEHMRKVMDLNTQHNRREMMLEAKQSEVTKALEKISVDDPQVTPAENIEEWNCP
ncbi:unnamed protein product [Knipowitschia caucasica]|uniref:Uncharacterized protein n=1 Tax=Knipowitschia caucasica TaxID=637954 RepID=A0AAV2JCT4_KNICA